MCAITHIATNRDFVPDCKTFKVLKRPNFVRSATKYTKECFYEHLYTHRSNNIIVDGKRSHYDFWFGNLFSFLSSRISQGIKGKAFRSGSFRNGTNCIASKFFYSSCCPRFDPRFGRI